VAIEEFVPFMPGEAPWELAGAEMSPERAALEAKVPPDRRGPEAGGSAAGASASGRDSGSGPG
jgi:hypothetical protein